MRKIWQLSWPFVDLGDAPGTRFPLRPDFFSISWKDHMLFHLACHPLMGNPGSVPAYSKIARIFHPTISCVMDCDATTAPARHMWQTQSSNRLQFMPDRFIRFPEFIEFSEFFFHLGKNSNYWIPWEDLINHWSLN